MPVINFTTSIKKEKTSLDIGDSVFIEQGSGSGLDSESRRRALLKFESFLDLLDTIFHHRDMKG